MVNKNLEAFLNMLAWAEIGTEMLAASDHGYNILVGSLPGRMKLFTDYSDHPRKMMRLTPTVHSTAAGRYQILMRTYDHYRVLLKLPDFSPSSQDAIAVQLIKERRALQDIYDGKIVQATHKVRTAWASLPDSPYGQPTRRVEPLILSYRAAGGTLA